jgi:hypothetical protein
VRTRTVVDVIEQLIVLQDFTQNQRSDPMVERVVVNAEKSAVHHSFPDCRYIWNDITYSLASILILVNRVTLSGHSANERERRISAPSQESYFGEILASGSVLRYANDHTKKRDLVLLSTYRSSVLRIWFRQSLNFKFRSPKKLCYRVKW